MSHSLGPFAYTQSFPAADDEPCYIIIAGTPVSAPVFALGLDSMNRSQVYPPSADWLRRLAARATEFADRIDELEPGWERGAGVTALAGTTEAPDGAA